MQELQFARREDDALIVTNDAGEQFRIAIDEYLIAEIKQVSRPERSGPRVKPREIQSLIRAGKSRAEVVAATGADESDVERHEGPVLAERRYLLDSALLVPVRAQGEQIDDTPQTFGNVINARLAGLGADSIEWTAWRDQTDGWMISLTFRSREVDHKALWSFEHRKSVLAPLTSDAVTLSQQGDVGDRLIPKLRAVDTPGRTERFDSGAFDPNALYPEDSAAATAKLAATTPLQLDDNVGKSGAATDAAHGPENARLRDATPTGSANSDADGDRFSEGASVRDTAAAAAAARDDVSAETAYERRQEIEQRAISSHEEAPADLGQTADLLDALRRRRGERESARPEREPAAEPMPRLRSAPEIPASDSSEKPSVVQADPKRVPASVTALGAKRDPATSPATTPPTDSSGGKKRRASIPSWDDILFGTRSEDDPA